MGSEVEASSPADEALELATSDPPKALTLATRIVADGELFSARDRVKALRALGMAARTQMDFDRSLLHFGAALQLATESGLVTEAAMVRLSRCASYALTGRHTEALADIDAAVGVLTGQEQAKARNQRANILVVMGRVDEALATVSETVRVFRRAGDLLWEARARGTRSYALQLSGSVEAGEREARAARDLYLRIGHRAGAAYAEQDLAILAGLRGDIPAALEGFERAAESYRQLGIPPEQGADAQTAILLAARLATDARRVAAAALVELRRRGATVGLPELLLAVARSELLLGAHDRARTAADEAAGWFADQGLEVWASLAQLVSVTARFGSGERSVALQDTAVALAGALRSSAWLAASLEADLIAGRVAVERGDRPGALRLLRQAAAARRGQVLASRLSGWEAHARVELLEGRPKAALQAVAHGMRLVDDYREVLGATEMRVGAAAHGENLAHLGLQLAFAGGRPAEIFAWSERHRAAALLQPPARPPKDQQLSRTLARLRSTTARLAAETAGLGPATAPEGERRPPGLGRKELERQQRRLEQEVRQLTHAARGSGTPAAARPTATAIRSSLGDAVLLQIISNGDQLHAVVLRRTGVTAARLCPAAAVDQELIAARFALGHLTRQPGSRSGPTMLAGLERSARRLDDLLFGPVMTLIGDRPLIVSPPGQLHLLPWSMLPTARDRMVTVAPSAAAWLRATSQMPPARSKWVLAAGPGLDFADTEVNEVARHYPSARVLVGPAATAVAVARALSGATLAHLACHGRFRADNPSFSSLQLAGGPLYVYDLERLKRPPHVIVLSACDSGLSTFSAGDEVRGLAAALLALGTQTIVASVLPVRDEAARALMADLHLHLAAGAPPAAALARAQSIARATTDPAAIAAAGAFMCFGAGWPFERSTRLHVPPPPVPPPPVPPPPVPPPPVPSPAVPPPAPPPPAAVTRARPPR